MLFRKTHKNIFQKRKRKEARLEEREQVDRKKGQIDKTNIK
jgi:hypothetical protein